jgi:hypothetical protein
LIVDALMAQLSAVETAQLLRLPGAAPARDLAFQPELAYAPRAGILSTAASSGEGTTADVRGILFGDRDTDGVYSDGEPRLSGRVVRLVDEQGAVLAEATTGPEGEYRFAAVPTGRYRVEAAPFRAWAVRSAQP